MIIELYTPPNIEFTEIITEPIIAGMGEMQNVVVEISQQNLRGQSSTNITEIPNNYHKSTH